jgi:hypothetical protein
VSITVCLATKTLHCPHAGGHCWVYLNWALGLRAIGCRVIWLESVIPTDPIEAVLTKMVTMKDRLPRLAMGPDTDLAGELGRLGR